MDPGPATVTVISCSTTITSYASWPWVEKMVVRVDRAETSELAEGTVPDVTAAIDVDVIVVAATGVEDGKDADETDSTAALDVVAAASEVVSTEAGDETG